MHFLTLHIGYKNKSEQKKDWLVCFHFPKITVIYNIRDCYSVVIAFCIYCILHNKPYKEKPLIFFLRQSLKYFSGQPPWICKPLGGQRLEGDKLLK
jgi:hypothetical protein